MSELELKVCIFCGYSADAYYGDEFLDIPNHTKEKIYHAHPFCILFAAKQNNQWNDASDLIGRGNYEMTYGKVDDIEL
jgi:hypothetical protein